MNGFDSNDHIDLASLELEVRRLRAQAMAESVTYIRGWFAARRAARRNAQAAGLTAGKTRAA